MPGSSCHIWLTGLWPSFIFAAVQYLQLVKLNENIPCLILWGKQMGSLSLNLIDLHRNFFSIPIKTHKKLAQVILNINTFVICGSSPHLLVLTSRWKCLSPKVHPTSSCSQEKTIAIPCRCHLQPRGSSLRLFFSSISSVSISWTPML